MFLLVGWMDCVHIIIEFENYYEKLFVLRDLGSDMNGMRI